MPLLATHRFWKDHCKYLLRRDEMQDRESALRTRLANGRKELDKLQRTNVYSEFDSPIALDFSRRMLARVLILERESLRSSRGADSLFPASSCADDAFCIGQEAGFGTINGLRLGRLPSVNVRRASHLPSLTSSEPSG